MKITEDTLRGLHPKLVKKILAMQITAKAHGTVTTRYGILEQQVRDLSRENDRLRKENARLKATVNSLGLV